MILPTVVIGEKTEDRCWRQTIATYASNTQRKAG
jgi:hypothetical protein